MKKLLATGIAAALATVTQSGTSNVFSEPLMTSPSAMLPIDFCASFVP